MKTLPYKKSLRLTLLSLRLAFTLWFLLLLLHYASQDPFWALGLLLSFAVPFFLVGLLRRVLAFPRPYQSEDFTAAVPRQRTNDSFPSRHAFSAFAIATLTFPAFPIAGALLGVLAILLATLRVLVGIHYPRDVIVGGILGVLCGTIGIWVFIP